LRAVGGGAFGDDRAAGADAEPAAGEILDEPRGAIECLTTGATWREEDEVEGLRRTNLALRTRERRRGGARDGRRGGRRHRGRRGRRRRRHCGGRRGRRGAGGRRGQAGPRGRAADADALGIGLATDLALARLAGLDGLADVSALPVGGAADLEAGVAADRL